VFFPGKDLHFAVCDDRQENVDKICEKDFGLILKAKFFFFFFSFVKFWIFGIVLFLCDLQRLEGPGSICCFC